MPSLRTTTKKRRISHRQNLQNLHTLPQNHPTGDNLEMNPKRRFNLECTLAERLIQREDAWKDFGIGKTGRQEMDDVICLRHYNQIAARAFELVKNLSDEELKEALE